MKGISTPYEDNEINNRIMTFLTDISGSVDELNDLIKEYGIIRKANQNYLDMNRENIKKEDELKNRIKDTMVMWDMSKAGPVTIRHSKRKSFDFATADCDGFDYSKYLKNTNVNVFDYKDKE